MFDQEVSDAIACTGCPVASLKYLDCKVLKIFLSLTMHHQQDDRDH